MLNKLISPFNSMMSKLKYSQKFLLISVLFIIPVVLLLYIWISIQQSEIKLIKGEQVGVEQISEVMPFMLQLQQHRGLVNGYLNGNKEAKTQIEEKQREIVQWIEQIETSFQKQKLPQTYERWGAVKEEWYAIHSSYESLKASDSFARHSALVKQVEELIVSAADESDLTLDSGIESYYMMKLIVQELPKLIESSAIIRGRGNGVLASGTMAEEIKNQLVLEASKSETALVDLKKSVAKIAQSNHSINKDLVEKGEQVAQSIQNYLVVLDREILNKQEMSMKPDTYFAEGTRAITTADEVFKLAAVELGHTLQGRINDYTTDRDITLLITAIVLILVALFYVAFYRNVLETVGILKQRAEAMANGDFSENIVLNTKDELQLVGTAFNEMQRSMNRVLSKNQKIAISTLQASQQLTEISQESTMAMKQVADSVQEVSDGTALQKRATAETSTVMNEISIGISRIAESASEVANVAIRANENAILGDQQLGETVKQMNSIKETQEKSAQVVAKLDEHSALISQINEAIMDIAAQTKLLALNASIEAAHAGEFGRGFSIVAREVGKLAEETSKSGNSISDLLSDIRSLVGDTVSAMHSMQTETNTGMESIERSKAIVDRILSDIKLVSEQIQEVSATSEEMSAEMEEVTASITEVADISHQTSNEAETMAAATEEQLASMEQIQISAEELRDMSQQLQHDLSVFVLRDDLKINKSRNEQ